jgi:hypothetical protein
VTAALRDSGSQVVAEVPVVGFDDIEAARYERPPRTTIATLEQAPSSGPRSRARCTAAEQRAGLSVVKWHSVYGGFTIYPRLETSSSPSHHGPWLRSTMLISGSTVTSGPDLLMLIDYLSWRAQ